MIDDPLFIRLLAVRETVETGRADAQTTAQWHELCQTVRTMIDRHRGVMDEAPAAQRERAVRQWIENFADRHWPVATLH